jgi:hypothetical protein
VYVKLNVSVWGAGCYYWPQEKRRIGQQPGTSTALQIKLPLAGLGWSDKEAIHTRCWSGSIWESTIVMSPTCGAELPRSYSRKDMLSCATFQPLGTRLSPGQPITGQVFRTRLAVGAGIMYS